ncbi:MAG TPA: tetratricopeptide repeat protein, partial [Blastocatellia bacterium]|nr:tetratricopeptide repeat protein [Blastocatellia bacterium]
KPDLYFELSLADALITRLAGLGKIRVLPTTSRAAGRDDDPIAAGRKLGADLVISGLIRKIDGNVRVCIHLISVNDGTVLWATQFNALADDMFILQETICMQVVQGLGPLLGEKSLSALRRNSADPEAYEAYLRGSYYWNNPAPESLAKSIECFEYATKRDAGYALAYAMLADSQALLSQQLTDEAARAETAARSWENALKALELNPNLAEAHIALGLTVADSNRQEAAYRRALQLDPNNAVAYHRYATMLYGQGRIDESLESFKRAHNLDQLSYATWTSLAPLFNHKGKPESRTGLSPTVTGRHPGGLKAPACFAVARRLQKCNDRAMAGIDPVLADPGNTPSP